MQTTVLVIDNVRSTHNIGSLFRLADGLGIMKIYLVGISAYPMQKNDTRLPHQAQKLHKQINKTALGATATVAWHYSPDITSVISELKLNGFEIVALEQTDRGENLYDYKPPEKVALIIGNEIDGLPQPIIQKVDTVIEIPMSGSKESFNVATAAAMALYHIQYFDKFKA